MTNKQYISLLIDLADLSKKVRREMEGMIAAHRALSAEEHGIIKDLLEDIQTESGMADSLRFEAYSYTKEKDFAVIN